MEYDGLNRLKRVSAPALWGDAWYGYDALDNLTSSQVTAGAKARTLTHNINYSNNRLDSVTGSYTLGYQYDSQGNIILRGGQSYSFDIGNRMRSAPGITTHAYDGLGRRTSVVGTDGVNHIYVYGQEGKLLYETTTGQALASGTKYVYLNRHVVAEVNGGGVVYDHTDGLGSPVAKTSSTAGLISRTRYEPYGATAAGTEPTIGFTGHLNAANLGLVDMQQRFYDPVAGRFLSIDPVVTDANNANAFNRYVYASNNPYRYIDPDGRWIQIAVAVAIGAVIDVGLQHTVEHKAWRDIDYKGALISGAGAAITGMAGARFAQQAIQGTISATQAVVRTAATGGLLGGTSSAATDAVNGNKVSGAKIVSGAIGGAVGAAVGAKVDNAAAGAVGRLANSGGVASHVAETTRSSTNFGAHVMMGESTGQALGKNVSDVSIGATQKFIEQKAGL